jgi:predicted lysophospholipase L1 biosynthesis ABC-type transport system permease subunit
VRSEPGAVRLVFDTGLAFDAPSPEATAVLLPAEADAPVAPLPVLVTPDLRDAAQVGVGDEIVVRAEGTELAARVVGIIAALPGAVDAPVGVLVDRSALVSHKWLTDATSSEPTEVVASAERDGIGAVRGALAAPPISSREVLDRWAVAEDRSQDPTTIGIIGGLVTGVGAALVMSILGLILTAVVNVRQRTAEFAVLRALGQTRRELRRSLLAEVVPVTALSTLVGIGAGVALAWRSLSSLTAAGDGIVSVPDPVLVVPWVVVAAAAAAVAGVAIALPLVVAGALGRGAVAEELRIGAPA